MVCRQMFQGEEGSYFLFRCQPLLAEIPELKRRKMKEKSESQPWGKSAELRKRRPNPIHGLVKRQGLRLSRNRARWGRGRLNLHQGGSRSV